MQNESAYYQLAIPTDQIDSVFASVQKQGLSSVKLKADKRNFLALKILPQDLKKFDDKTHLLKLRFFIFRNVDFKHLLKNAKKIKLDIKNIRYEEIDDEELEEEIEKALKEKNYDKCLELIEQNYIVIKSIDGIYNFYEISFYENGMIWLGKNLSSSKKIIDLLEKIFSFLII